MNLIIFCISINKLYFDCLVFPYTFIFKVAVGTSHVAMVTMEHAVYTWGSNCCGQLGHGDCSRQDKPTQVEALKSKAILK